MRRRAGEVFERLTGLASTPGIEVQLHSLRVLAVRLVRGTADVAGMIRHAGIDIRRQAGHHSLAERLDRLQRVALEVLTGSSASSSRPAIASVMRPFR
jgi:hypothetical protein